MLFLWILVLVVVIVLLKYLYLILKRLHFLRKLTKKPKRITAVWGIIAIRCFLFSGMTARRIFFWRCPKKR